MKQQRTVDTVDGNADVRRPQAAQRELGAEVVAVGDPGQHLHRAEGIVSDKAAQRQQVAAAQHRLADDARLAFAEGTARDRDILHVCTRAFGHWNRDVDGRSRGHRHFTPHEAEANHGDEDGLLARWNVSDLESAIAAGERLLSA